MYKDLKQEAATLTKWLIGIPSVTGTNGEAVAIKAIYDGLTEFPYFKRHPGHLHYIPHEDQKNSSLMALVKAHDPCTHTIVLISNVDTAGAESFGALKPLACQVSQLKEKLKSLNLISKKDKDAEGNLYGLGSYECKAACGSLIALVKEFSDDTLSLDFNVIFLCLSCSYQDLQGMRACSGYLPKLLSEHRLKPVLSLCLKPNFPEHQEDEDLHLYTGNLGVCEPSFFILGKGCGAGRPFNGFSPTLIASSIIKKLELNSQLLQKLSNRPLVPSFAHIFSRSARNHQSPDAVQISFNLTFSSLDLSELIEFLKEIACDAVMECSDLIDDRQIYYHYLNSRDYIPEVKDAEILSYTDLFERARHHYKGNLAAAVQALADKCRTEGLSERETCFCIIERLNELSHLAKPSVVVFMGPSFIPAQGLRSQDQHDRELIICLKNTLNRMEQSCPRIPTLAREYPGCDGNLMRPLGLDDAMRLLGQECPCGTKNYINFNCPNITLGIIGEDLYESTEHVKEESFTYITTFIHDLMQELAVLTGRRRRHVIGSEHEVGQNRLDNEIKEPEQELPGAGKIEEEQKLEDELQRTQTAIAQSLRDTWQDTATAKKSTGQEPAVLLEENSRPKVEEMQSSPEPRTQDKSALSPKNESPEPQAPGTAANAQPPAPNTASQERSAAEPQDAPAHPRSGEEIAPAQTGPQEPDTQVQEIPAQAQEPNEAHLSDLKNGTEVIKENLAGQEQASAGNAPSREDLGDKSEPEALKVTEPPKKKGLFSKAVSKFKSPKSRSVKEEEQSLNKQSHAAPAQGTTAQETKLTALVGNSDAAPAAQDLSLSEDNSAQDKDDDKSGKVSSQGRDLTSNIKKGEAAGSDTALSEDEKPSEDNLDNKVQPAKEPEADAPDANAESDGQDQVSQQGSSASADNEVQAEQTGQQEHGRAEEALHFAPASDLDGSEESRDSLILLNVVPASDLQTTVEQDLKESREAQRLLSQNSSTAPAPKVEIHAEQDTIITDSRGPEVADDALFDPRKNPSTLIAKSNEAQGSGQEEETEDTAPDPDLKAEALPGRLEAKIAQDEAQALKDEEASDIKDKEGKSERADKKDKNSDLIHDLKNMLDAPPENPLNGHLYSRAQSQQSLDPALSDLEKMIPQISLEFTPAQDEQEEDIKRKQSLKASDPDAYHAIYSESVGEGPHIISKDSRNRGLFAKIRRHGLHDNQDPDDLPVVIAQEEEHSKRLHKKDSPSGGT